ncbi:retrovirus-related pol polyprotein from transposon TNT 1-94 [Tanacetum coccineum]
MPRWQSVCSLNQSNGHKDRSNDGQRIKGTIFKQSDEVVLSAFKEKGVVLSYNGLLFNKESNAYFLANASPRMENLNQVKVKELRSHNGTEFRNHKLEEFCKEKEAVNTACFTQNRSIIVKRHRKTAYDVFRGRAPDVSYFHVFGCPIHIHNHKDHLGKFDEKADDRFFLADILESAEPQDNVLIESINDNQPAPVISPSTKVIPQNIVPQDRWSRDKHINLVNIIGESLVGITTKSRIRDSDVASAHECLYVNFLSKIEPKKLTKALEEEGWVLAMTEELNQFERNKVWTLVPKPYGKTIIGCQNQ